MVETDYNDFAKLELRVGEIVEVTEHPNANKLLVMKVDLGEGSLRTIVAGLKNYYTLESLTGKKAIFVANLKPAVLRGVESNGMILAAVNDDKTNVIFLKPKQDVSEGANVKFKNG